VKKTQCLNLDTTTLQTKSEPEVNIDIESFCQNLVPYHQATSEAQQAVQRALSAPSPVSHNLRKGKNKINNRALHLRQEIKQDIQEASQDLKENANQCGNPSENQPKLL
jgi:uncharacterized protein with ATP-grasp and redox domains